MKIQLLGGPRDGEEMEVPDKLETVEVPVTGDPIWDNSRPPAFGAFRYQKTPRFSKEGHVIFALTGSNK